MPRGDERRERRDERRKERGNFYFRFLAWGWREPNPIHVGCCSTCCCELCAPIKAVWTFSYGGVIFTGENVMAELREGQQMNARVEFKTAGGNPAAYQEGSVVWSSSDPAVVSVEADPGDEKKATVKGLDGSNNASVNVECRADGDPDADQTRDLVFTAAVTCTQGEAVTGEIVFDGPTEIVPSEPPA